jgi:tRNA-specific 2-thiouridylase
MGRVLVAMSGGVDSSVAAAILHEQGHEVVGVAMKLVPEGETSGARNRSRTCCSHDDFEDARRVAERFGFPFYVVDMRAEFGRSVINNFVSEYLNGRTPNPCARCNSEVKFDLLWRRARAIGAEFIATGHYARIRREEDGLFHLMRAYDQARDQSYFLFALGQSELARTLFPLGDMTKAEVRERARAMGLANANKPDSQEICFVTSGNYKDFVERASANRKPVDGLIVDPAGNLLGRHRGIHHFTVGQRRGLGVASSEPLYVHEIRAGTGEVVVGPREGLSAKGLTAKEVNLVDPRVAREESVEIDVKIRYRHPALRARLTMVAKDFAEVRFVAPGPAVSPGQACVFYRHDEVLGGGFIERSLQ